MSNDNIKYTTVAVDINDDERLPDVHLEVLGVKLDLPNLNSADLPIDLVNVILLVKSQTVLSEEQTSYAMAAFLAYFQQLKPDFWSRLRTTGHAIEWLTGTVKAWAEQSGIDPKAWSSAPYGATTVKR